MQEVNTFLDQIKQDGRSSPSGMHWNDFFVFLKSFKQPNDPDLPVPLILAASGASDASKHDRLSRQLEWAMKHNCVDEAIAFLKGLSRDKWNRGSLENWHETSYWDLT